MKNGIIIFMSGLFIGGACEAPPTERDCDEEDGVIEGQITSGPTGNVISEDLTVRGVARHTEGHVIRRVVVAGIAAKNDGFNFEQWSAVIPIGVLGGLPAADMPNNVTVEAVGFDGCDRPFSFGDFTIAVDRTPGVRVERLAITVDFPGNEQADERFLPANGDASAVLRILANADARGASVTLTSNVGSFEGVGAGNVAQLSGDGMSDASATVLFSVNQAQDAIISAHTKTVTSAPLVIDVAGPPTFIPTSATLEPGKPVSVTVFTDGKVDACQASPVLGISVMSGNDDLMTTAAANDSNGDGRVDFVVEAVGPITAEVKTIVTCRDRYGQMSMATFKAVP